VKRLMKVNRGRHPTTPQGKWPPLIDCRLRRFTYSEHLCATDQARALGCWTSILHGNRLSGTHLPLRTALHAITLHGSPPCLSCAYSTPKLGLSQHY